MMSEVVVIQVIDLKHKNITNQVVEYLRKNIENGVWSVGEKISSEHELSATLNVSRASVRFAIQQLIAVGVLESIQGKGTYVQMLPFKEIKNRLNNFYSNSEVNELLEFRRIVEVESCRLVAQKITDEALGHLQEYLDNMRSNADNSTVFIENDMKFHREILKAMHNRLILQSMDCMNAEMRVQQIYFNTAEGVQSALTYHAEILEALKKHDGARAAKIMAEHIDKLIRWKRCF